MQCMPTHHMCAIRVFEGDSAALNESQPCVLLVYPDTRAATPVQPTLFARSKGSTATRTRNIWAGSDSDFAPSPEVGAGSDFASEVRSVKRRETATSSKAAKSKPTNIKAVPPPPVLQSATLGLVLQIRFALQKRNPWKPCAKMYRNICLLCCEEIIEREKKTPYTSEEALRITKHTSNAKDHITSKHKYYPLAVLAEQTIAQKAKDDVVSAEADTSDVLDLTGETAAATTTTTTRGAAATANSVVSSGSTGRVGPQRFFKANEKTLHVLISKWLITQVIPFTACRSAPFDEMMRAAMANPDFPMLSRDRHDKLFQEFGQTCKFQYLNLIHDMWTNCGKDSIAGASVAFIDTTWGFSFIAMLVTVKNDGHNAPQVAKVIESGFQAKYDVYIRSMARFTESDTTPSARNVAYHIDTEQEDCSMHLLNLLHRDNIQMNSVWNAACHSWDRVVIIVTPGGSLEEGGTVTQKLRNINNYFRSPKQRNTLKKIQEALSYPELDPMADKDVRVAYTYKLIRRSVVNYAAFEAYFQSTKEPSSALTALSPDDWTIATKMEAGTHFIANLALVEAQSENLVSSYMVVFRRLAEKKLKSFQFETMVVEAPRATDANEASHRRQVKTLD
ncbi:hypothetical protein PHMEG_00026136 [Phytophthora megakarya]|uniref:MULE transposase domain-containing protein n=1 Tax=Phytophthora megakarya TaxID=4795 RepID=A0A225VCV6_9STRA|nr:hypothetical protein PHMEG_00026136 [Phytophthora megakarya]